VWREPELDKMAEALGDSLICPVGHIFFKFDSSGRGVPVAAKVKDGAGWGVIFLLARFSTSTTDVASRFRARHRDSWKYFTRLESTGISQTGHLSGILTGDQLL